MPVEWRWQRGIMLCSALSATTTVACIFLKPFAAVGGTIFVLFIDWSGVIAGLSFFLCKGVCGELYKAATQAAATAAPPSSQPLLFNARHASKDNGSSSGVTVLALNAALFLSILAPGLGSALVVQTVPEQQNNGMAKWEMVVSVLASVGVGATLCC